MEKAYVIAEIAQGFEGNLKLCEKFVKVAKESGAHAVKFQIFLAHELCRSDYQYNQLFKDLEISSVDWTKVINYASEIGIDFYADIFGVDTLDWITKTKIKGIKIHGSDIKNYPFLEKVSQFKGKIILSLGGSELGEIEKALEFLKKNEVILMSGFQGEPNFPSDVELNKIKILKDKFNCDIGYADHIDANEVSLALTVPTVAYLSGATYIEKHLTFERNSLQLEDCISALNPSEFKEMSKLLDQVSGFNKNENYVLSDREKAYRVNTKKVPLINKDVQVGHTVGHNDIVFLRIGAQKPEVLLDYDQIIGKKLTKGLKKQDAILMEHLK